nr:DUF645 family protein [Vibrio cholerae]
MIWLSLSQTLNRFQTFTFWQCSGTVNLVT